MLAFKTSSTNLRANFRRYGIIVSTSSEGSILLGEIYAFYSRPIT